MVVREAGDQSKKYVVFLTHLPGLTYKKSYQSVMCRVVLLHVCLHVSGAWGERKQASDSLNWSYRQVLDLNWGLLVEQALLLTAKSPLQSSTGLFICPNVFLFLHLFYSSPIPFWEDLCSFYISFRSCINSINSLTKDYFLVPNFARIQSWYD